MPARHHERSSQRLRADPTAKKTPNVIASDAKNAPGTLKRKGRRNGSSGTRPHARNAPNVARAAARG